MIKILLFAVLIVAHANTYPPPQDGKFFYADFSPKGPYGQHMVTIKVGRTEDRTKEFDMVVTTSLTSLVLFTEKCGTCNVP